MFMLLRHLPSGDRLRSVQDRIQSQRSRKPRRSESSKGSERSNTPLTTLKMAVLSPIPSTSVRTAVAVKPELLRSIRSRTEHLAGRFQAHTQRALREPVPLVVRYHRVQGGPGGGLPAGSCPHEFFRPPAAFRAHGFPHPIRVPHVFCEAGCAIGLSGDENP